MPTLRAHTATPAYNRRKSPRVTFHHSVERLSRRRGGQKHDYLLHKDDIGIRLADGHADVDQVGMLVTRMYRSRGYLIPAVEVGAGASIREVTLEACYKDRTIGTMTVNLGGNEGLNAEALYAEEIGRFREKRARVCEFTRLAVDAEDCGKQALGCLFHLGFIFAYRIHHATDLFIEVNPRHALFYRRKLGFTPIGDEKICPRVNAPAVLLHKRLEVMSQELVQFGGVRTPENKSFYAWWLPAAQENELVGTIEGMLESTGALPGKRENAVERRPIEDLARSA